MNKFKVGDRIIAYYAANLWGGIGSGSGKGIINNIRDNGIICMAGDNGFKSYYHYKCCRKLVKKVKND